MMIDEVLAEKFGISGHQRSYLNTFLKACDIRGRHILEVGGAMPGDLVIGHLGAESWTSVQSKSYELLRDDNQVPRPNGFDGQYKVIYKNIEELGLDAYFRDRFDFIFSIACFEHLHKLPDALKVMHLAAKTGARLFSMFAPIWSGAWGHHFSGSVPSRFNHIKPDSGWSNQTIFRDPWDHLLLSRTQFFDIYRTRFDEEFAIELMDLIYNSAQINRYFFEDYKYFIKSGDWKCLLFEGFAGLDSQDEEPESIKILKLRYADLGYTNFSHTGIVCVLEK